MNKPQHHRAFLITVIWTLGLLFLGSIVHATESSLACPDWPTCFGTMVPEMTGGVFWEHLHRLVAGGLILFFLGAIYLTWKERPRQRWLLRVAGLGLALLLVQAVLGGVTVLLRLPDAISTSHLGLAFLFLVLSTALAVASSPGWEARPPISPSPGGQLRRWALGASVLVFVQSLLGAAVRHTDAGMACPDVPLCLGQWVPPLAEPLVALHFTHRVMAFVVLAMVLWVGHIAYRKVDRWDVRGFGLLATGLVLAQVLLGFLAVYFRLAVVPVSLHTLLAASLLTLLVALATLTWAPGPRIPAAETES